MNRADSKWTSVTSFLEWLKSSYSNIGRGHQWPLMLSAGRAAQSVPRRRHHSSSILSSVRFSPVRRRPPAASSSGPGVRFLSSSIRFSPRLPQPYTGRPFCVFVQVGFSHPSAGAINWPSILCLVQVGFSHPHAGAITGRPFLSGLPHLADHLRHGAGSSRWPSVFFFVQLGQPTSAGAITGRVPFPVCRSGRRGSPPSTAGAIPDWPSILCLVQVGFSHPLRRRRWPSILCVVQVGLSHVRISGRRPPSLSGRPSTAQPPMRSALRPHPMRQLMHASGTCVRVQAPRPG